MRYQFELSCQYSSGHLSISICNPRWKPGPAPSYEIWRGGQTSEEVQDGSIFSKQVTKNGRRLEAGKENYDTLGSEILDANWRVFVEVNACAAEVYCSPRLEALNQCMFVYHKNVWQICSSLHYKQWNCVIKYYDVKHEAVLTRFYRYSLPLANYAPSHPYTAAIRHFTCPCSEHLCTCNTWTYLIKFNCVEF